MGEGGTKGCVWVFKWSGRGVEVGSGNGCKGLKVGKVSRSAQNRCYRANQRENLLRFTF